MLTRSVRSRLRVGMRIGCAAAVMLSGVVFTTSATSAAPGDAFTKVADTLVSITPARFVDTRPGEATIDGQFAGDGKRTADSEFEITIAGRDAVPADAAGVVVNVTAVAPDDRGYITLHPCVSPRPVISSLNYVTGINTGNEVIAALSADGSICAYTLSSTHVTIDVVGYVPANSEISPIVPARLLETRPARTTVDDLANGVGRTSPGSSVTVQVAGRGGVPPTGVDSVFVNVTAVNARERGYVTVHACLPSVPSTSSLNYVPMVNRGNELLVELSAEGEICLFTNRSIHLTVDIVSYIETDSTVATIKPFRLADSRPGGLTDDGADSGFGPQAGRSEYRLQVTGRAGVPADAEAAVVNLTAVAPTTRGYFTVHPCVSPRPLASSLNYTAGVNGANEIIAGLSPDGELCIFTNTTAHMAVDIVGYLQAVEPIAEPDAYNTIGNVLLEVGVAPGAFPAVTVAGDVLANDDSSNGSLTVTGFDAASARGGTVAMGADGTFSYTPPAGVTGVTDTFSYEVAVDGVPTDSGTVSIAIDDIVWFVDNTSAAATKTGTSNAPFDQLADAGPPSGPGEPIFVYKGDGTDAGYDKGITLDDDQHLIGEKVGLTVGGTVLVPPGGGQPSLSASGGVDTVTMGAGGSVESFLLEISGSGAAISSSGAAGTVVDVEITANSEGIELNGTSGTFTFTDVDVSSAGGASVQVNGGSAVIDFTNSSINQTGSGPAIDISDHTGSLPYDASNSLNATNGTGLQFDERRRHLPLPRPRHPQRRRRRHRHPQRLRGYVLVRRHDHHRPVRCGTQGRPERRQHRVRQRHDHPGQHRRRHRHLRPRRHIHLRAHQHGQRHQRHRLAVQRRRQHLPLPRPRHPQRRRRRHRHPQRLRGYVLVRRHDDDHEPDRSRCHHRRLRGPVRLRRQHRREYRRDLLHRHDRARFRDQLQLDGRQRADVDRQPFRRVLHLRRRRRHHGHDASDDCPAGLLRARSQPTATARGRSTT